MDKEPHMTVLTPRRGRPVAAVKGTTLSVWMPTPNYDQICRMATKQEKTVSALVRDLLVLRLK